MSVINNIKEVLHRIRVKLYPNYLPNVEGAYIARTNSEASLSIEEVCAALKNRGGFTGNYEDLVDYVRQYFDEAAYQLCDGFSVSTGYYSIHPNIGGTFNNDKEIHDRKKHPISFRFRTRSKLRKLIEHIAVDIEGIADTQGYIMEFIDVNTDVVNEAFSIQGQFIITGYKIKIAGDHPDVGVYLLRNDGGQGGAEEIRIEHLAENTSSKIIGQVPMITMYGSSYKLVIKTQFTGSGSTSLKSPRIIEGNFNLTVA